MWKQTFISTCWPHREIARIKTTRPSSLVSREHVTSQLISVDGVFLQDQMFVLTSARHECASHDRSRISRGTVTHTAPPWQQQTHSRYGPGCTDKRPRYQHSSQSGARQEKTTIQHPTERSVMRQITRWGRRTNHRALACKKMCLLFIIFRFSTR